MVRNHGFEFKQLGQLLRDCQGPVLNLKQAIELPA